MALGGQIVQEGYYRVRLCEKGEFFFSASDTIHPYGLYIFNIRIVFSVQPIYRRDVFSGVHRIEQTIIASQFAPLAEVESEWYFVAIVVDLFGL